MKIYNAPKFRATLTVSALTLFGLGAAAHALPDAPWDTRADDAKVLVKGVSSFDALNGQTAPNGTTRSNLTQGFVDYLMTVFEWTFQLKMTGAERSSFGNRLSKIWMTGEYEDNVPGAFEVLMHRNAIDQYSPDAYLDNWSRTLARNEQFTKLRKIANTTDKENGQWLLNVIYKTHPVLAKGEPQLTTLTTDALTDRVVFMINEIIGKKAATATPTLRKRIADDTAALWPKISVARRQEILKMEEDFYYLQQKGWNYRGEGEREELRIAWGTELQGAFPAVKPMVAKRKAALDAAKKKDAARWAKMSPTQQKMLLMQMQQQFQMQSAMAQSMSDMRHDANIRAMNADTRGHVARMNIIEGMKSRPERIWSVK